MKAEKEKKVSGVYKITNRVTGGFYIGSSKDIKYRWTWHKWPSAWKKQPNFKLYKDMQKYGIDSFIFEIIEETAELKEREQYWIEQLKPAYNSIRADGQDIERYKAWHKAHHDEKVTRNKAYYQSHLDEILAHSKVWHQAHRAERAAANKAYNSRLCLYNGETLTLNALGKRLRKQGILHAIVEAKKYLIEE